MKPRWLLLAVSVICLLVLFPAAALSQAPRVDAGCGTANIDGRARPREWASAGKVDLYPLVDGAGENPAFVPEPEVRGSQADMVTGEMWVMNDLSHFYLAVILNMDSAIFHPDWWGGAVFLMFADEPGAPPGQWAAPNCGLPLPGEGWIWTVIPAVPDPGEYFSPQSQLGDCGEQPLVGVQWEAAPGSVVWEYALDLNASELDKVGPGDCFPLGLWTWADGCEEGTGCPSAPWLAGSAQWPQSLDWTPATFGEICLDPCEVEFVPEPGTIMLLGSGLAGLAGYAILRLRTREYPTDSSCGEQQRRQRR